MADYLAQYTDQQVEEFAKKIAKVYAQAAKEIQEKYDDYAAKYAVKDQKKFADYLAGKITLEKYQSWLKGQVFIGKQWEQKVKDITNVYLNADKKAYELLSDTDESVFTEAANHSAYEIEQGIDGAISFDLFDKETVKRLIKDNPKMLPEWKIDQPKDYIWNEERVQNAVSQAIIQGEKIPDIAKRLGKELATNNAKKMVLFARTATNGAQNAGRIQRMHETADMGLDVRKEWIATSDSRVRDTHRELNGQICKEGEKFKVGTQEIEYPGDPTAAPALVYNCRCSLGFVYPKYNKAEKGLYYIGEDGQKHEVTDMTYKEWTAAKEKEKADKEAAEKVKENYDFNKDKSFSASLNKKLSPYSYEIPTYEEYKEKMESWTGERTKYIEDVRAGTIIDFKSDASFYGEEHCAASRVDNAVARCQELVPLFSDREKLVVCDYDSAKYYLPDGESDRRLSTDAIAQVFQNKGQTVIAVNREWMTGTLKESLESRKCAIKSGEILPNVFPKRSPEAVILHEWGHTVHDYFLDAMCYDDKNARSLWDWFRTLEKDEIKSGLSEYASTNFGEFCAECFAEMQAEDPRPLAKKYWEFMEPIIKRGEKRD